MTITKLIEDFLSEYATEVAEDEDEATTELYIDDHDYIEYKGKGYYIPDSALYDDDEALLKTMILNTFSL